MKISSTVTVESLLHDIVYLCEVKIFKLSFKNGFKNKLSISMLIIHQYLWIKFNRLKYLEKFISKWAKCKEW